MNTLPPELILATYTKMDGVTANKFRATCRDYNRIFCENDSRMPKHKTNIFLQTLDPVFFISNKEDGDLQRFPTMVFHETSDPTNRDCKKYESEEEFDLLTYFTAAKDGDDVIREPLHFYDDDPLLRLEKVVKNLGEYFHLDEISQMGWFDDRMAELFVNCFSGNIISKISFDMTDISTGSESWKKFLDGTRPRSLHVTMTYNFVTPHPFSYRMINPELKEICMPNCWSHRQLKDLGVGELIAVDTVSSLIISHYKTPLQDLMSKIERWIVGDFPIKGFRSLYVDDEYTRIGTALSRFAEERWTDSDGRQGLGWRVNHRDGGRYIVVSLSRKALEIHAERQTIQEYL